VRGCLGDEVGIAHLICNLLRARAMANTCTKEICDTLIELMSQGYTQDEVCAVLGVNLGS
jgi:hypothetical protein